MMEEAFNKVIEKGRFNIVLDASEITFVSSAGWWALIRVQKLCKGKALNPGELVLVNLDPKIRESMDLVGMMNTSLVRATPIALAALCGTRLEYQPIRGSQAVYAEMYKLYRQLHDGFGTAKWNGSMFNVMKDLLSLRDRQRQA